MKKIYMIPSLEVTKIQTQNMFATSGLTLNGEGEVESGELINTDATSAGLSRTTIWDDDEE